MQRIFSYQSIGKDRIFDSTFCLQDRFNNLKNRIRICLLPTFTITQMNNFNHKLKKDGINPSFSISVICAMKIETSYK